MVIILRKAGYKTGRTVQTRFQIKLHEKDRPLLLIQKSLGSIGKVYTVNTRYTVEFRVNTLKFLLCVIVPHF